MHNSYWSDIKRTTVIRWWTITYLVRLMNAHYRFGEDIWTHFSRGHLVCHANINFLFSVLQKITYLFSDFIPTKNLNSEPKNAQNQTKGGLVCQSGRPSPWQVHEKRFQYGECYWTIFPFQKIAGTFFSRRN